MIPAMIPAAEAKQGERAARGGDGGDVGELQHDGSTMAVGTTRLTAVASAYHGLGSWYGSEAASALPLVSGSAHAVTITRPPTPARRRGGRSGHGYITGCLRVKDLRSLPPLKPACTIIWAVPVQGLMTAALGGLPTCQV